MSDNQSACSMNYSCESPVMKIVDKVLWGMKFLEVSSMYLLDLSTASDTLDHNILLSMLNVKFGL